MNKAQMIMKMMEKPKGHVSHIDMQRILDGMFEEIRNALANGEDVMLSGLGTFTVRDRAERTCINPQTKEQMTVPAKRVPVFKAGTKLKIAVEK